MTHDQEFSEMVTNTVQVVDTELIQLQRLSELLAETFEKVTGEKITENE
jgi:hypothetical protein